MGDSTCLLLPSLACGDRETGNIARSVTADLFCKMPIQWSLALILGQICAPGFGVIPAQMPSSATILFPPSIHWVPELIPLPSCSSSLLSLHSLSSTANRLFSAVKISDTLLLISVILSPSYEGRPWQTRGISFLPGSTG